MPFNLRGENVAHELSTDAFSFALDNLRICELSYLSGTYKFSLEAATVDFIFIKCSLDFACFVRICSRPRNLFPGGFNSQVLQKTYNLLS